MNIYTIKETALIQIMREKGYETAIEYRFFSDRKWRFDYAWPEYKVALEVEGAVWTQGRHTRPQGFLKDMEKYNTATLNGWHVIRVTWEDMPGNATDMILQVIENVKHEKNNH